MAWPWLGLLMPARAIRPEDREELLRSLRLCYWRTLNTLDGTLSSNSLTARQYLLLKALEEFGPLHAQELCRRLFVTPADVTGLSDRLVKKELIRRRRGSDDRRRVILEITETGRRSLSEARRRRDKVVDSMIRAMPPAEFKALMRGLGRILEVTSQARQAVAEDLGEGETGRGPSGPLPPDGAVG